MTHDPYAALRFKTYRWYLSAHTLTTLGLQMQTTALSWLIYEKTGSAALLGLSGLALFLPVLLLSFPVGHLVDEHPRRQMLQIGHGLRFVGAIFLAIASFMNAPLISFFATLVVVGIGNTFTSIAKPSILRDIVNEDAVENANNWNAIGRRTATIIGPIIAGLMITKTGDASAVFAVNAVCLIIAFNCVQFLPLNRKKSGRTPMSWKTIGEGIRFIRTSPIILSATLLDMFAVLLGGATILLPIFAKDILMVGPTGLGFLVAAPSIGSLVMTIILAHRKSFSRAGMSLLISVALFGVTMIVFGFSTNAILSFIALVGSGIFDAISVSIRSTILQLYVPERLRGRVFAVNMIFAYSSNEFGDFESGMVASLIGAEGSVIFGGIGAVLIAMIFGWHWKELRMLGEMKMENNTVSH